MDTLVLKPYQFFEAGEIIRNGGIVAIPTETVYGLAAGAFFEAAIKNIYKAKGRPSDNPLIVHIADLNDVYKVVREFPDRAKFLAKRFWPGPLTMILPKNTEIPGIVTANSDSVAVRSPSHPIAQKIIKAAGVPVVAPSANLSGKPSTTVFDHVVEDLMGKVDAIVDGGMCEIGVESTVVSLLSTTPKILRPGAITLENISSVLGEAEIDKAVFEELTPGEKILSPGMKYKHYAPKARVIMVEGSSENYAAYVNSSDEKNKVALCLDEDISLLKIPYISYGSKNDSKAQAHNLFDDLRKTDDMGAEVVYAHFCGHGGVSDAVYNRLIRASAFNVVKI